MRFSVSLHRLAVCIAASFVWLSVGEVASSENDIGRCDTLASHPRDPGRYAAGVTDEQFAPGAAIDACRAAVEADPALGRAWFQLGRAFWIAERDSEAFAAFAEAAKRGYAPAMKFIGDAYRDGRGLPGNEKQSLDTAVAYYRLALKNGYRDAQQAIDDASSLIASLRLDPAAFQNQDYIKRIYEGNFDNLANPLQFLMYVGAFSKELGGNTIFFVDSDCRGMVTSLSGTINGIQRFVSFLHGMQSEEGMAQVVIALFTSGWVEDQGVRDAGILANLYSCKSPVTRRIVANIVGSWEKLPAIVQARLAPKMEGSGGKPTDADHAPLHQQKTYALYWGAIAGRCGIQNFPSAIQACNRVLELIKSKNYKILHCSYGPFRSDGTGFEVYQFWSYQVPDSIASYQVPGDDHPFSYLGKQAVGACPKDTRELKSVFQLSRL
jgi:TPR repeat protein